jgi:hypothetical protein
MADAGHSHDAYDLHSTSGESRILFLSLHPLDDEISFSIRSFHVNPTEPNRDNVRIIFLGCLTAPASLYFAKFEAHAKGLY